MSHCRRRKTQRSLGRPWIRLRDQVVREEPLCRLRLPGCTVRSTTADHIVPRSRRPDLEMVRTNLRGSCRSCNLRRGTGSPDRMRRIRTEVSRKTAKALEFFG